MKWLVENQYLEKNPLALPKQMKETPKKPKKHEICSTSTICVKHLVLFFRVMHKLF